MTDDPGIDIDMDVLLDTAAHAGEAILEVYAQDFEVETKEDSSPLTEADRRANAVILNALNSHYPNIPIISEETKTLPYDERKGWEWFWLVDPLDGTKEFVKKNGEFTVNIALIRGDSPWAGVVYQPVTRTFYYAYHKNGAFRRIGEEPPQRLEGGKHYLECEAVTVVASRSHLTQEVEAFVEQLRSAGKQVEFLSAGSSLKLCLVAEGKADVYPRLGPTMEWDTAAAHSIAIESGRTVLASKSRNPLIYNKKNLLNPWFIVE
jgi:3'(2'), 5'-bisphosphate nucleotidase